MNPDELARALPRPNPGPEPWPFGWHEVLSVGISILTAAAIVLIVWTCLKRSGRGRIANKTDKPDAAMLITPGWQGLTDRIRAGLIARFGPGFGSMTTEELAGNPALHSLLDPRQRGELLGFLNASDRARFRAEDADLAAWVPWVDAFLKASPNQPGAAAGSTVLDGGGTGSASASGST